VEALAEVEELATVAQHPEPRMMQKAAKGGINSLKGIVATMLKISFIIVEQGCRSFQAG
jgi:hypothetical protein